MPDTTLIDEEPRVAIVQQMREQTDVDEAMIEQLVRGFHAHISADDLLGPTVDSRIRDWD